MYLTSADNCSSYDARIYARIRAHCERGITLTFTYIHWDYIIVSAKTGGALIFCEGIWPSLAKLAHPWLRPWGRGKYRPIREGREGREGIGCLFDGILDAPPIRLYSG